MADTIRLRFRPQEGKDYTTAQSVIDSEGYTWNFGENQTQVIPQFGDRQTLAANATVVWGTATAQQDAPQVEADIRQMPGRI